MVGPGIAGTLEYPDGHCGGAVPGGGIPNLGEIMPAYNCPDNVSASDPEAPWNKDEAMEEGDVYQFRDFYIPSYMMGGIERYIRKGIPPGDFLTAVICNDLAESVARADDENIANLPAYVAYFYNEAPGYCWGSKERMKEWMEKFQKDESNG